MKRLLRVINISKTFELERVITQLSFDVFEKDIILIKGPSGAGKTTILNLISGLLHADSGEIQIDETLKQCKVPLPIVFQEFESVLPWLSVYENVKLACSKSDDAIMAILEKVKLKEDAYKIASQLSGGMKRRVCIAQALSCDSKVILMDEPFSNLDSSLREEIEELIITLRESEKLAFVIVTHESPLKLLRYSKQIESYDWKKELLATD